VKERSSVGERTELCFARATMPTGVEAHASNFGKDASKNDLAEPHLRL
jgi:hypothetical protein